MTHEYKNSFENDLSFELTTEDEDDDSDDVSEHELLVFLVVKETEETEEEAEVGELGSRGCFLVEEEKEREEAGGGAREITSLSSTWLGSTWCFFLRLHLLMHDPMDMNWGREWE